MTLPASIAPLYQTLVQIQGVAQSVKLQAQSASSKLAAGNVDSDWVFTFLDQMRGFIVTINGWLSVPNLDTYATANVPSYAGTLTTDLTAVKAAGQACIDWVVSNFPTQTSGGTAYILSHSLASDGTRTPRQFTSAQTAGLRTLLTTFISTIG